MFEKFGDYLRDYRITHNYSQIEFSSLIRINVKYLSRIENKKLIPRYKVVKGFMRFTGMSMKQLESEIKNYANDLHSSS